MDVQNYIEDWTKNFVIIRRFWSQLTKCEGYNNNKNFISKSL